MIIDMNDRLLPDLCDLIFLMFFILNIESYVDDNDMLLTFIKLECELLLLAYFILQYLEFWLSDFSWSMNKFTQFYPLSIVKIKCSSVNDCDQIWNCWLFTYYFVYFRCIQMCFEQWLDGN